MTQSELLDRLESDLNELLKQVRTRVADQPREVLLRHPSLGRWNTQECFAHLNAQFDYFLPRIELALHKAKARRWLPAPAHERQSNWLGRRAIHAVDPANLPQKPRRSPKAIDPLKLLKVRENEVKVFLINIELMLRLLRQAREVDINMPTIKPMRWNVSSFLLGDLLEYLVLHSKRHTLQAQATIGV
ncbi:MAG: DinB family protein [Phycisphaerae bacterium]|nr:DinB family protein [Saprospiraceae bacterium]